MEQYLSEVMARVSTGGLSIFLIIVFVCLIITSVRSKRATPTGIQISTNNTCPACKQEIQS